MLPIKIINSLTKIIIAVILIFTLIALVSADITPHVQLATIFMDCVIAVVISFAILIFVVVVTLTFKQFILCKGGTDAAWFWFNGEPPGLEKLRTELKEFKKNKV